MPPSEEREELVLDHLSMRCWILNRMFALHVTDAEMHRFEEVNKHLFQLSREIRQWHQALQEQMSVLHTLSGKPFELETTLNYHHDSDNPQLHVMEDDAFYGSRWNEMLWTIQYYNRLDAESCGEMTSTTWMMELHGQKDHFAFRNLNTSASAIWSTRSAPTSTTPSPTSSA